MNSTQSSGFVETLEHRRFAEFCDACGRYRYIGLCYGRPGVGKTLSARRCSRWDYFDNVNPNPYAIPDEALAALIGVRTIFYTTPVVNTPRQIDHDIVRLRSRLRSLAKEPLRREAEEKLKQINIRDNRHAEEMFTTHDWLSEPMPKLKPTYAAISRKYAAKEKSIDDPTQLILVDEADRLKMASLEQMRAIFDAGGIGLVLIGMPGLEKRLARYAQFYSRIGFVHEFRPLNVPEMRWLLAQGWVPAGVTLPAISALDAETATAIIRVTGGNFRLLDRLLTQVERIMRINDLTQVTKEVVESARESLVIGPE
jgi:DNA transposition AAA+ family ATPase